MQFVFLAILIGALAAGVVVLASMGWLQRRRRIRLARVAYGMELRFSARDPFELTRRYSSFVLPSAGHSPRAENVIYGRHKGWHLRAFDYRFEAGHGPRRLVRRYSVIVADTDLPLPPVLMWSVADTDHLPLAVRNPLEQLGGWLVISGEQSAALLAEAFAEFQKEPVDLQVDGGSVMLSSADPWKPADLAARMDQAAAGLELLRARCGQG